MEFHAALKHRRSIYGIGKHTTVPQSRIEEIIREAVMYTPSSFNSQSARVVILFGEHHNKLWDLTTEILREKTNNEEKFTATAEKMAGFRSGFGTVLFFEDNDVIETLQNSFPSYKDKFPDWSHHSSGMLQYVVWTSLEIEGLGASLQHYNPLIDAKVKQVWNIPLSWTLIAEMPFGEPTVQPGEKDQKPLEQRIKVYS